MVAVASATGIRAWLRLHRPAWITARRMKLVTAALLTLGVLAAGLQV